MRANQLALQSWTKLNAELINPTLFGNNISDTDNERWRDLKWYILTDENNVNTDGVNRRNLRRDISSFPGSCSVVEGNFIAEF